MVCDTLAWTVEGLTPTSDLENLIGPLLLGNELEGVAAVELFGHRWGLVNAWQSKDLTRLDWVCRCESQITVRNSDGATYAEVYTKNNLDRTLIHAETSADWILSLMPDNQWDKKDVRLFVNRMGELLLPLGLAAVSRGTSLEVKPKNWVPVPSWVTDNNLPVFSVDGDLIGFNEHEHSQVSISSGAWNFILVPDNNWHSGAVIDAVIDNRDQNGELFLQYSLDGYHVSGEHFLSVLYGINEYDAILLASKVESELSPLLRETVLIGI